MRHFVPTSHQSRRVGKSAQSSGWRFFGGFVLLVLMVPLIPFAILGELPGDSWVEHPRPEYVFVLGVLVLTADVFLPVPSSLIAVFLGARLGPLWGTLAIMAGLNLGAAVGYCAGRCAGSPLLGRFASGAQLESLRSLEGRLGYVGLAMARSVPVLSEASVLAAGAARWSVRRLWLLLLTANACLALVYGLFGATGASRSSPAWLFAGGIVVPAIGVSIVLLGRRLAGNTGVRTA